MANEPLKRSALAPPRSVPAVAEMFMANEPLKLTTLRPAGSAARHRVAEMFMANEPLKPRAPVGTAKC